MLFLSKNESRKWRQSAGEILDGNLKPSDAKSDIRHGMMPVFCYYAGMQLAAGGKGQLAKEWFRKGALSEESLMLSNAYIMGFLDRHDNKLTMPEVCFADPRPYLHFISLPIIQDTRRRFLNHCAATVRQYERPFRFVDMGCGDGSLTAEMLLKLRESGKVGDIEEIMLVDSSPAMLSLAKETVGKHFDPALIRTANIRIQEFCAQVAAPYDLALCSLSIHHMPFETKLVCLQQLKPWIKDFIIFELEANNDSPELGDPELALSIYQSYGRMLDMVFAHDAPVELVLACADRFWITEIISIFTQPRGKRTEYHMLRMQWHELFKKSFGDEFSCYCDSICYGDEHSSLFAMHYGR